MYVGTLCFPLSRPDWLTGAPVSPQTSMSTNGLQSTVRASTCTIFYSKARRYATRGPWLTLSHAGWAGAVVDLFNNLNLYYSVVTEFCTVESNPTMSAGPG